MDYIVPESHLCLLQAVLKELVMARDPDVVFLTPEETKEASDES